MTPDERAAAVLAEFSAATDPATATNHPVWEPVKLIAAAIRAAENEVLERAEAVASVRRDQDKDFAIAFFRAGDRAQGGERNQAAVSSDAIAKAIRSLISKD